MDELTFSLTGRDLEAVQHLADSTADDYFERAGLEALRTSSRGVPHFRRGEGGTKVRDGWRITFVYRSRPGPDPVPSRLAADGLPADPEFDVDPDPDAGPVGAAARRLAELQDRRAR